MASALSQLIETQAVRVKAALQAEIEAMVIDAQQYHINAVRNWQGKPRFVVQPLRETGVLGATLAVTGEHADKWKWVDLGTGKYGETGAPYWIYPRKVGGKLTFRTDYQPRTRPIAKANVGPGVAVGEWVSTLFVLHPGIKGREFTKTYTEKLLVPQFKPRLDKAVQRIRTARSV